MLEEFKDFLFKGNLIELAVAFVMGLAFAAVVNSLVNNLVMPIVAAIIGIEPLPGTVSAGIVSGAAIRSTPSTSRMAAVP